MSILQEIRTSVSKSLLIKKIFAYYIVPSGLFDGWFLNMEPNEGWKERIRIVQESADNAKIQRVEGAGTIKRGVQLMHNGLKIALGSYYGPEVSRMLYQNKGVHEPQEEYAFQYVLDVLKSQKKQNYTMLELGSFWAFYSMWFKKDLSTTTNIMVEPESFNIGCGLRNFNLNGFTGTFINSFVSHSKQNEASQSFVSVDSIFYDYNLNYIDIVHCDIQGYETDMLSGAVDTMRKNKIGYFFISTHSNDLHAHCINTLQLNNYLILASANMEETYSFDGLIVARHSSIDGPTKIHISRR